MASMWFEQAGHSFRVRPNPIPNLEVKPEVAVVLWRELLGSNSCWHYDSDCAPLSDHRFEKSTIVIIVIYTNQLGIVKKLEYHQNLKPAIRINHHG